MVRYCKKAFSARKGHKMLAQFMSSLTPLICEIRPQNPLLNKSFGFLYKE